MLPLHSDKIAVGSYQGLVRIYQPQSGSFSPDHLLIEHQTGNPVLQVEAGRFIQWVYGCRHFYSLPLAPLLTYIYTEAPTRSILLCSTQKTWQSTPLLLKALMSLLDLTSPCLTSPLQISTSWSLFIKMCSHELLITWHLDLLVVLEVLTNYVMFKPVIIPCNFFGCRWRLHLCSVNGWKAVLFLPRKFCICCISTLFPDPWSSLLHSQDWQYCYCQLIQTAAMFQVCSIHVHTFHLLLLCFWLADLYM